MSGLILANVVRSVRDLPSLPAVVLEVMKTFQQCDVNTEVLAEKVSQDQALAAKTLRLANSSFYGLQRKVVTIQQAITILGFDSVRTIITAAAVTDAFKPGRRERFDSKAFWRHSVGTAVCAKMMARQLNLNHDFAFVSGLLHDVGKLVLVTKFPELYDEVLRYRAEHDCFVLDAERAVLTLDHSVVGRALAEYWKFPPSMQRAIANHHAPETEDLGGITAVVHIADALAHGLDLSQQEDDVVPSVSEAAWNSLALDAPTFRKICRSTESEFEEACQVLVA